MNRIVSITIVCGAALGLGLMATKGQVDERSFVRGSIQFERSADFPLDTVEQCLRSGNGSRIFSGFEYVRGYRQFDALGSTYVAKDGSRLTITKLRGRSLIVLRSDSPPTIEQSDLLNWCAERPTTTWIAERFRSGS